MSSQFNRAYAALDLQAKFKTQPEHFRVFEQLPFECSGSGEHLYIHIRKTNQNTQWLARQIAKWASVTAKDVSYAGLKDRHGITEQWFSVWLPGQELDAGSLAVEGVEVLEQHRHSAKLRRGALSGNRFEIILADVTSTSGELDRDVVEQRLQLIKQQGVPNYFGDQRFGHDGNNVSKALASLSGKGRGRLKRDTKSLHISALRSYVFNQVLSQRVEAGNWHQRIPGEPLCLDGSRSWFLPESLDAELLGRIDQWDCHPSGPLWGRGRSPAQEEAGAFETTAVASLTEMLGVLENQSLKQERRPNRLRPQELSWHWQGNDLHLAFGLTPGCYATSMLRELIGHLEEPDFASA